MKKIFGRKFEKGTGKRVDDQVVGRKRGNQIDLLINVAKRYRGLFGRENLGRRAVEREDDRRRLGLPRLFGEGLKQSDVSAMKTVELTDRQDAPPLKTGKPVELIKDFHRRMNPFRYNPTLWDGK
jgi:hypothetical protein